MRILVISGNPEWIRFVKSVFEDVVVNDPTARCDLAIVDETYFCVPADMPFVVVTGQETIKGAVASYKAGALAYFERQLDRRRLQNKILEVRARCGV